MILIGIDIGVTGAVAAIDAHGSPAIEDIPTLVVPGKRMVRRRVDPCGLAKILRRMVPAGEAATVVFEDVHAFPGTRNSPQSQGSLMHSRGMVEAVVELARFSVHAVQPSAWKRFVGLIGEDKREACKVAATLYPSASLMLERLKDHNRADALLLAHYGRRCLA